ncbi:hypothetical protein EDB81DRAFT_376066 [Dactylonectria macrodidyma]|uniref:NACHT domain-containing protein n=1 Tax=Dactylonectria macrodidyma TaxID=307937 RepID=A0A9P9JF89_9HYPO|nr:hypothetical protein EDB81DRAFT_376066 [Dactylonectria macrodidyma]
MPVMGPTPAIPDGAQTTEIFEAAQDRFLGSLQPEDHRFYSPCASSTDFLDALKKLECVAKGSSRRAKNLRCLHSLTKHLQPFFNVVNIFIQSNPDVSALFWGSFRLVLHLSSGVVTFFDKLLELLAQLLEVFPRYESVAGLCCDENSGRIRQNIQEVYVDMLEIFQAAVRVFTRSSGKLKRTPVVLGSLLWQPFDVKFQELLEKMEVHKHNITEEVRVWELRRDTKEHVEAAKWREYVRKEHQDAHEERRLAQEERRLMTEERKLMETERDLNEDLRQNVAALLSEIRAAKDDLEKQRLEDTVTRIQKWLKPSDHVNAREMNAKVRNDSTATWIFREQKYRSWLEAMKKSSPGGEERKFGPNLLWLHGHPGSGKTVLATSILDNLDDGLEFPEVEISIVLYHFFQFHSDTASPPVTAYRSLLSQILWHYRHDKNTVDKFSFVMTSKSQGQLHASEKNFVDLIQACLDDKAVVVVDGVDECDDSDSFVNSLLQLSRTCAPKILLLSRISVPRLQHLVRPECRHPLPKTELLGDIRRYCNHELRELIDDDILPWSASEELDGLTSHLVNGADGMFLWARLMMEFLRSPMLTRAVRVRTIKEINFPEGLEKMYKRIFLDINQSGNIPRRLATHVFTWMVHCPKPMTTRQIRQALTIDSVWKSGEESEDVAQFESAVIMACRGLVELVPSSTKPSHSRTLKLIHLTVREILTRQDDDAAAAATLSLGEAPGHNDKNQGSVVAVPRSTIANLRLGRCCLRQLLDHSLNQPLAGTFHKSITSARLAENLPFTDYAAVYWMDHTRASIAHLSDISGQDGQLNKAFETAFSDFAGDLELFLNRPKTVTAWLEAYYTASHTAHPSGSALRRWASWVSDLSQETQLRIKGSLLGLVFEFHCELDRIVKFWGSTLDKSPHVVWDEAAASGLRQSNLFFSPGSTRVTSRAPERPDDPGIAAHPVVVESSVSADGSLLGVLSIWPDKYFVSNHICALSRCLVSYELWPLNASGTRLMWLTAELDGRETERLALLDHLGEYVLVSMGSDLLSFSVSHQIWRLKPSASTLSKGIARDKWATPIQYETVTIQPEPPYEGSEPMGDSVISLNHSGEFVILNECFRGRDQEGVVIIDLRERISAFALTGTPMKAKLLETHTSEPGDRVGFSRTILHPTLPLCVLQEGPSPSLNSRPLVHIWAFQRSRYSLRICRSILTCVQARQRCVPLWFLLHLKPWT